MRSVIHAFLPAFCVGFFAIFPAQAEMTTLWIKKNVIEARLVLARDAKQHFAGIEFVMEPGWHTYWRYPGASGIAPSFDFSASQNVKTQDPVFPAPYFFDDGAGGFFGYEGLTGFVVPFLLENAGEGAKSASIWSSACAAKFVCRCNFHLICPLCPALKNPRRIGHYTGHAGCRTGGTVSGTWHRHAQL